VTRLPVAAFVALAVATVGAFFVTQALKVTTPLINGFPAPVPSTINPVGGGTCRVRGPKGKLARVSFRVMRISFYLQNRGDVVDVSIVDPAGNVVAQLPGSGRYLGTTHRRQFTWNGRESNGRVAPDGAYDIRVRLVQQDRELTISDSSGKAEPVTVLTRPPRLSITGVSPHVIGSTGAKVTIRFTGNGGVRPRVLILRISRRGRPRLVKSYAATAVDGHTLWNGTLSGGRPAPPGSYLVALRLTDRTCNTVSTPQTAAAGAPAVITVR
jgi:flagellar hook assembly protein FlgD